MFSSSFLTVQNLRYNHVYEDKINGMRSRNSNPEEISSARVMSSTQRSDSELVNFRIVHEPLRKSTNEIPKGLYVSQVVGLRELSLHPSLWD